MYINKIMFLSKENSIHIVKQNNVLENMYLIYIFTDQLYNLLDVWVSGHFGDSGEDLGVVSKINISLTCRL
jgi:hypothetical protein